MSLKQFFLLWGLLLWLTVVLLATAQPRAPISWGAIRYLSSGPTVTTVTQPGPQQTCAKGDTILLAYMNVNSSGNNIAQVRVTTNNGTTWSPWNFLTDTVDRFHADYVYWALPRHGIYAGAKYDISNVGSGIFSTTNGGNSWQQPRSFVGQNFRLTGTTGDTMIIFIGYMRPNHNMESFSRWTNNGGLTYSPPVQWFPEYPNIYYAPNFNITGNKHYLFATCDDDYHRNGFGYRILFERRTYDGQRDGEVLTFNDSIMWNFDSKVLFDDDGNGVLLVSSDTIAMVPDYLGLQKWVSHDHGRTWSARESLTERQSADDFLNRSNLYLQYSGSRWCIAWMDTTRDSLHNTPQFRYNVKVKFSPNRGYYWYPVTISTPFDTAKTGRLTYANIQGDKIRLYGQSRWWNSRFQECFWQIEGIITPDTLSPTISEAVVLPDTIGALDLYPLTVTASDNDTVYFAQWIVRRQGSTDSTVVNLIRQDSTNHYLGFWQSFREPGLYEYYYWVLDRWDNPGYFPTTAPTQPRQFRILGNEVTEEKPLPLTYSLKCFPNPFNNSLRIELSLPKAGKANLVVTDLLGRQVATIFQGELSAGSHRFEWNSENRNAATGIYFLSFQSGDFQSVKKVVLVK